VGMSDEFEAARGWSEKLRRYVKGNDDFSDANAGTCRKGDPANNSPFVDMAMIKGIENYQVAQRKACATKITNVLFFILLFFMISTAQKKRVKTKIERSLKKIIIIIITNKPVICLP
jgi:hypothetical protein